MGVEQQIRDGVGIEDPEAPDSVPAQALVQDAELDAAPAEGAAPAREAALADEAAPELPAGQIFGLFGPEIRGVVQTAGTDERVEVYGSGRYLGAVPLDPAAEGDQPFVFALPSDLNDGEIQVVHARLAPSGRELSGALRFLGDPNLRLPLAFRRRQQHGDGAAGSGTVAGSLIEIRRALNFQTQVLQRMAGGSGGIRLGAPLELSERYGALYPEALAKPPGGYDVFWFGIINWDYRIQRPQHLAADLGARGCRVFYVSLDFETADAAGRFRVLSTPQDNVFEIRLKLDGRLPEKIYQGFTPEQVREMHTAMDEVLLALDVRCPVAVVEYPSWESVAAGIPGCTVVADVLDLLSGFPEVTPEMVDLERELITHADTVVTTSQPLSDIVARERPNTIIRNAAEVDYFAQAADFDRPSSARPVIGYFGAIAHWFEIDWIAQAARARPDWDFVLIGLAEGCDVSPVQHLPNVRLLGERPYEELPDHLRGFDVAIIPFKLIELIQAVNPVKLYEYMAAGKAVVASALPEVVAAASDLIYLADTPDSFQAQVARALAEDTPALRRRRHAWARGNDWSARGALLMDAIGTTSPKVSVVVLCYNNWAFTRTCLRSILTLSDYPNLELVLVDNASSDETRRELQKLAARDPRVRLVLNDENLGFSGGNNSGIRVATGEYVILLNNDTYVTRGWVRDLIRPLRLDPQIGLAAPLTNNMGNEQKVKIGYQDMYEMQARARAFTRRHVRRRLEVDTVAFFCVAARRELIERVGLLDERYGLGFFEDDDYCRRVQEAGYRIVIVDDVFVHHHLSASFDQLGEERKQAQMAKNKAIYEARWGPWKPHRYRDAPGFG